MARFTALVWNIEQFGVKFGNNNNLPAANVADPLRCQLIGAIAQAADANVIVIQELRSAGMALLATLTAAVAAACGGTWHYDWLPGALTANVNAVQSFNDLGFNAVANSEGYAVLWRQGSLATLGNPPLSAGVDSTVYNANLGHYISLVTSGQQLAFNDSAIPITFGNPSGELGFPPSTCPNVNIVTQTRGGVHSSNDVIASRVNVRRPCAVTLTPANNVAIPLVVYHAPVGQNSSRSDYYGSLIGFASAQCQDQSAVYAGDFNVVSVPNQASLRERAQALNYNLDTYIQQGSTGPITPSPSVIHYVNHAGTGFRTGQQVFGSGRDYAFIRKNGRNVATLVIDALESLRGALFVNNGLTALGNAVNGVAGSLGTTIGGVQAGAVVQAYLAGQALPGGADERTALAIIYRDLVTDHLPVAIRYQV